MKFLAIKRRGFTLIESLAVIAIIGILLALGMYVYTEAAAQARDAGRKSDLDQVSQAFNARFLDKTCPSQYFPGEGLEQTSGSNKWIKVRSLVGSTDPAPYNCATAFTTYLPTIPDDVRAANTTQFHYYFNLSTVEPGVGNTTIAAGIAKHFRLTTALEHQFTVGSPDFLECVRLSDVWAASYGGQPYDCKQQMSVRAPTKQPWSLASFITHALAKAVSAPTGVGVTAGTCQDTINWSLVAGATQYNVKRSATTGGPYTTISSPADNTPYIDTNVTGGTSYYYVLTALSGGIESGNSTEGSGTPTAGSGCGGGPSNGGTPIACLSYNVDGSGNPPGCTGSGGGGGGNNPPGPYNYYIGQ